MKNSKKLLRGLKQNKLDLLISSGEELSYSNLCEKLNIEYIPSGSSKLKQLKQLDSLCEYEKRGVKYKMVGYRTSNEIVLHDSRAKYTPFIEAILSNMFNKLCESSDDGEIMYCTALELMEYCDIVNSNFRVARGVIKRSTAVKVAISALNNIEADEFTKFINISYNKILKPIIRTALKSLDNRHSIMLNKGYRLYSNTNGVLSQKNVLNTSRDGIVLSEIEADILTELNINNGRALFLSSNDTKLQYYQRCNELCQDRLGFDGFYDCYAIVVHKKRLKVTLLDIKRELNQRIKNRELSANCLDEISTAAKKTMVELTIARKPPKNLKNDLKKLKG